ncbi:nucleotidyltransferase domain-containing protein [Govanella unica]|uniref:Nucleotidyltransferase family protein n=1 Tax=Govanella unica TaxID=2975056 RepID=A0A9X3Z6Z4_9PROT|nr:nucleotidyltransferase family protein [Govania unica]MDA5193622.1 nucleotidyltransferase family protein [Govania unica]
MRSSDLLLRALRDPASLVAVTPADWSRLVYLGRASVLLARIAADARAAGIFDQLPANIQGQLRAAERQAALSHTRITWEIDRLKRAFWGRRQKIVLLKGAAYMAAQMPCAVGRPSSDIDILVAHADLTLTEATLMAAGWEPLKTSDYDQQYYRDWMHELPPLRHPERNSMIDVHHTILPLTGRLRPDADKLLAAAVPLDDDLYRLADTDMLLHSAVHLFQDGEVRGALRDVLDQRDMLRDFAGRDPNYWGRLIARAEELGLGRPLYYSLRYVERLFAVSPPATVRPALDRLGPPAPVRALMDRLVESALFPTFLFEHAPGRRIAGELLYLRSHWLRMPPLMLARHLSTKALKKLGLSSKA